MDKNMDINMKGFAHIEKYVFMFIFQMCMLIFLQIISFKIPKWIFINVPLRHVISVLCTSQPTR